MQQVDVFELIKCMAALIRSEQRRKCAELRLMIQILLVYAKHVKILVANPLAFFVS